MYLLGALGAVSAAKIKTSPCKTVNASSIDANVRKTFKVVPAATEDRNPGFNKACDCYYWGYRPEILQVLGLHGLGSVYGNEWNVCLDAQTSCPTPAVCPTPKACPAPKVCPPKTVCPGCPPPKATSCPQPVPCPTCAPCDLAPPAVPSPSSGGAYGPTVGFILAAAVVGGAGYFAYKKLHRKK